MILYLSGWYHERRRQQSFCDPIFGKGRKQLVYSPQRVAQLWEAPTSWPTFCKQRNRTNPEDPIGPTWSREDFLDGLGFSRSSPIRQHVPLPSISLLSVFFLESGKFFRGDPSVFLGRCFQEKIAFQRVMGMLRDWPWNVLSSKFYGSHQKEIHLFLDGIPEGNSFGNAWKCFEMAFFMNFLSQTLGEIFKWSTGVREKKSGATTLWARRLGGTTTRRHGGQQKAPGCLGCIGDYTT